MTKEELINELYCADRDVATSVTRSPIRNQTDSSCDKVIWILKNCDGEITPTEICRRLRVTTPRVTTILNSMEEKGYIVRVMSTDDRRKITVHLTEKGAEYDAVHEAESKDFLNKMYDALGADELLSVVKYLRTADQLSKE